MVLRAGIAGERDFHAAIDREVRGAEEMPEHRGVARHRFRGGVEHTKRTLARRHVAGELRHQEEQFRRE